MNPLKIFITLGAGITSFFSPCILPVLPGYMAYLAGVTAGEREEMSVRKKILLTFLHSVFFVLGFSIVFISLGASASLIGIIFRKYLFYIIKVAGVIIVILGLQMIGILKIKFLERGFSIEGPKMKSGFTKSFLSGFFFSFCWTPCISPVLAGILTLASQEETVMKGAILLAIYSAGMGIPLILIGTVVGTTITAFTKITRHARKFEILSGIILIFIGILILSGSLERFF